VIDGAAAYCTCLSRRMFVNDVQGCQTGAAYSTKLRCVAMYTVRISFLLHTQVDPPSVRSRLRRWVAFWHAVLTWALTWTLNVGWQSNRTPKKVGVGFFVIGCPSIVIGGCQVASAALIPLSRTSWNLVVAVMDLSTQMC